MAAEWLVPKRNAVVGARLLRKGQGFGVNAAQFEMRWRELPLLSPAQPVCVHVTEKLGGQDQDTGMGAGGQEALGFPATCVGPRPPLKLNEGAVRARDRGVLFRLKGTPWSGGRVHGRNPPAVLQRMLRLLGCPDERPRLREAAQGSSRPLRTAVVPGFR